MSDVNFESTTRVRRNEDVLDTGLDDETVMMDIDRGRYYGLNNTGTRIWPLLAEPIAVGDLVEQLAKEFAVPLEQCEEEVGGFLRGLQGRGLLQVLTDETP